MLEVDQLTRSYGQYKAVDQVSFSIGKGEIVGLLGHNGAGKTTIMKMISGYLEPNQGDVRVNGLSIGSDAQTIQRQLGYLPENLPVYPEMIVADYLDYAADLKGLEGELKFSEIRRAVKATDISSKLMSPIATLSRGFKQRVGVAQAILGKPKLLILDEPTNGLDPEQTQLMRTLIKDIAKDATVILSTHIMQEVEALCSRVLMLRTGALVVDEKIDHLTQSNHLLLESSLSVTQIKELSAIKDVVKVTPLNTHKERKEQNQVLPDELVCYRLEIETSASPRQVSAAIASRVSELDQKLYSLTTERRDLETLFKEVNEGTFDKQEVNHAA
jgi:ABC-2 type transport system ATP-binding protein